METRMAGLITGLLDLRSESSRGLREVRKRGSRKMGTQNKFDSREFDGYGRFRGCRNIGQTGWYYSRVFHQ